MAQQIRFDAVVTDLVDLLPDPGSTVSMDELAEAVSEVTFLTKEAAKTWLYGQTVGRQARWKVLAEIFDLTVEAGKRGRKIDLAALKAKVAEARKPKTAKKK